ncbi:MAG: PQQ-binding-like beta-propeller repeat protein [Tepidisphaerales bacterium]
MRVVMSFVCGMLLVGFSARADNWPRFRGSNGQGAGEAPQMPNQWTAKDWLWRISLPGTGHSSPAIWDGRVFVTSADEAAGKRYLVCIDAGTGKILWQRDFPLKPYRHHAENNAATATPAVDESGVYVAWLDPEKYLLMGFDHEGKDLWSVDLGPFKSQHMNGSSPIVVGQRVVMAVDQDVVDAGFVIAVDHKTGQTQWKTPRRSDNAASSTPCIYESPGQPPQIILTNRTEGILSLDAATGRRLWSMPETLPFRSVASPVAGDGVVLGNCGEGASNRTLSAVRPPGKPDDKPVLAWQIKTMTAPYVPTPLIVGPRVFLLTDTGQVSCVELASGKVLGQGKIPNVGPGFYGSMVCLNDRLVCITRKGEVIVLSADKLEVLGRTSLDEATFATPAVAGGRVYFRTLTKLACIGK